MDEARDVLELRVELRGAGAQYGQREEAHKGGVAPVDDGAQLLGRLDDAPQLGRG